MAIPRKGKVRGQWQVRRTILHTWFDLWAVFFSWEGRRLAGNICLNANSAVASKNFKQRDYAKRGSAKHEGSF